MRECKAAELTSKISPKKTKKRKDYKSKKKKKNAMIICRDGNEYWTTQDQFWQWVREKVVVKLGDGPLHGKFIRETDQFDVVLGNAVLNLTHRNHLTEVLYSRRYQTSRG